MPVSYRVQTSLDALHSVTLSQKNDTDVAHYNFNAHQPISVIFGRDVAISVFPQVETWGNTETQKSCFQMLC